MRLQQRSRKQFMGSKGHVLQLGLDFSPNQGRYSAVGQLGRGSGDVLYMTTAIAFWW